MKNHISKSIKFLFFRVIIYFEIGSTVKESIPPPNETQASSHLLSSAGAVLNSIPSPTPIRQLLSPNPTNTNNSRHNALQRSPSSTTTPVTLSPEIEAFRSQRSSVSFDYQTPLTQPSTTTTNKTKSPTTHSIFPSIITKPRLKFSMVRDSAMATLGHSTPVYSMPITRDYSIDERTNQIVNKFLMHDPTFDKFKNHSEDSSHRVTPKRHHHRIRPKTFDESVSINNTSKQSPQQQQQSRSTGNKQRHHNTLQNNLRKHSQHQYPSVHLPQSIEQEEEEDSSDPATPLVILNQQSTAATRRENSMAAGSPSIIITGDDSGS